MKKIDLSYVYLGILLLIFGLIVLHAPLTVIAGTLFSAASDLVKSWKEILMVVLAAIGAILVTKHRAWPSLTRDKLFWVIVSYVVLHFVTIALMPRGVAATLAGLAIDLRYILYFALVYIALQLYPLVRPLFVKVGVIGAAVVTGFATLQYFLPKDILTHIGYGKDTIAPYMTVDRNHDYIRVNSTLRGPNPLGAYAAMVITMIVSFVSLRYKKLSRRLFRWLVAIFVLCSVVALWISYSRSALLAAFFGVALVIVYAWGKNIKPLWWIAIGGLVIVIAIGGYNFAKDNSFISNVVLHENPSEGGTVDSNDGHIQSLQHGVQAMLSQPFGAGVGSTGTASYHTESPTVIENQYLFVAHEVGWLGVALFLIIFVEIMRRLWVRRRDWLALGVFASGIGLAIVGVLLPVWADDTVSIIWWGLAAVAIASKGVYARNKTK